MFLLMTCSGVSGLECWSRSAYAGDGGGVSGRCSSGGSGGSGSCRSCVLMQMCSLLIWIVRTISDFVKFGLVFFLTQRLFVFKCLLSQ